MSDSKEDYPVVVFFPDHVVSENGYLCGEVLLDNVLKTKNYFIHEVQEHLGHAIYNDVIGTLGKLVSHKKRRKAPDWIKLKIQDKIPYVEELLSDHSVSRRQDCQIIIYNKRCFMTSELLLSKDCDYKPCDRSKDHFKCLTYYLKHKLLLKNNTNGLQPFIKYILLKLISGLKFLDKLICRFYFVLQFSTLAIHISNFVKNAVWGLELIQKKRGFTTLKSGNYILGLIGDWFGGLILIYWFVSLINVEDILHLSIEQSEMVVVTLKNMVHYLMGSPADLKLNGPLNNVLGKFFLFHIDLWWAFLGYSRPLLELGFRTFICLGSLGLSFQIAILADLLSIASFHVYIIYVYAARLYHAQVMGLASLSRLFLGRKRNPVPGRVDSCPYSTEQLLIGTIAFTILLFLLPTTLVYYIVFTAIRLVLIAVGGLLTQARFLLSALPLYSTLLWLCNSPTTTSSVRLTPKITSNEEVVLLVSPVQSSWWHTVRACMPDHISRPPTVSWAGLFFDLLTGRLIYPV